ncbi:MAG TPA: hypothetical protein VF668_24445 [Pyrinomonadaceae bacterium]|jgi:hypothetical protein
MVEVDVVRRFEKVYIGDSLIERIELNLFTAVCKIFLSGASLLEEEGKIFNPAQRYEPACLSFKDVKSITCPEGEFYLNNTVVDFEATMVGHDLVSFRLEMTGGRENETFMRSLVLVAHDFSLDAAE